LFFAEKANPTIYLKKEVKGIYWDVVRNRYSNKKVKLNMDKDTIRIGVLELMKLDERCRNDDTYLIWKFLREKSNVPIYIPFKDFGKMPSFESISRMRRHIQNTEQKLLPTSQEVREQRGISEMEWREWTIKAKNIWGLKR